MGLCDMFRWLVYILLGGGKKLCRPGLPGSFRAVNHRFFACVCDGTLFLLQLLQVWLAWQAGKEYFLLLFRRVNVGGLLAV